MKLKQTKTVVQMTRIGEPEKGFFTKVERLLRSKVKNHLARQIAVDRAVVSGGGGDGILLVLRFGPVVPQVPCCAGGRKEEQTTIVFHFGE
jgi:hypothetical protein